MSRQSDQFAERAKATLRQLKSIKQAEERTRAEEEKRRAERGRVGDLVRQAFDAFEVGVSRKAINAAAVALADETIGAAFQEVVDEVLAKKEATSDVSPSLKTARVHVAFAALSEARDGNCGEALRLLRSSVPEIGDLADLATEVNNILLFRVCLRLQQRWKKVDGKTKETEVADEATAADKPVAAGDEPSSGKARRPPDKAFGAAAIRDLLGESKQTRIAEMMTESGIPATQGQVSKWLKSVDDYRAAGGIMPSVQDLNKPETMDPAIIDMGPRQDGRTPRQRPRRDSDADSDE